MAIRHVNRPTWHDRSRNCTICVRGAVTVTCIQVNLCLTVLPKHASCLPGSNIHLSQSYPPVGGPLNHRDGRRYHVILARYRHVTSRHVTDRLHVTSDHSRTAILWEGISGRHYAVTFEALRRIAGFRPGKCFLAQLHVTISV